MLYKALLLVVVFFIALSAASPVTAKFDGAFSLVNLTTPLAALNNVINVPWSKNPRGQISYFKNQARMSAVLNHDPLDSSGNVIPAASATDSQLLATGTGYAGAFFINETGQYVIHYPDTTTNPKSIPELHGDPAAIAEPRCYRWFDNDNLLQLFVTLTPPGQAFDCANPLYLSLFWQRLPNVNNGDNANSNKRR